MTTSRPKYEYLGNRLRDDSCRLTPHEAFLHKQLEDAIGIV